MTDSSDDFREQTTLQLEVLRRRLEELELAAGEIREHLETLAGSVAADEDLAESFEAEASVETASTEVPAADEVAAEAQEEPEVLLSDFETEIEEIPRTDGLSGGLLEGDEEPLTEEVLVEADPAEETPTPEVSTASEEQSITILSPFGEAGESGPTQEVSFGQPEGYDAGPTVPPPVVESEPIPDLAYARAQSSNARRERKAFEADLEMRIGSVWLNRLGLVALLISFALLAKYANPRLMPWHRVLVSYLASAGLFGIGWHLRDRLKGFARPVMAGGIALAFFTGFAAYFLEPMACVSVWTSLILMSAAIASLFLCAEFWRSESTAGLAIFLGHVAAYVSGGETSNASAVAILILSITTLVFFVRHEWMPLSLFAVIAAFVSHFLWATRAPVSGTASETFWHNMVFLTSYYVIFLSADVIYRRRLFLRGAEAFSSGQLMTGRAVGPAALMMYVSISVWLFQQTGVYWDRLYLFLLPMAAVQVALVLFHHRHRNVDFRLYASAAVVFASLGLISGLDGLTLNLALAAEALLLLVLARVLNFWFLTPLAQIVLTVNFVHFWFSDSRLISSWPAFVGAVATATVYFVKARLMETAEPAADDPSLPGGYAATLFRQVMNAQSGRIAYLQVIAGSVLVFYQCNTFFSGSWRALAVAVLVLPIVGCAIWFKSRPMMVGTVSLYYGCLYQLSEAGSSQTAIWLVQQVVLSSMVATGLVALSRSRRTMESPLRLFGIVSMSLAAVGAWAHIGAGVPQALWFPLWFAVPAAFWLETELWRGPPPEDESHLLHGSGRDIKAQAREIGARVRGALPVVAAVLTCRAAWEVFASPSAALWFLSVTTVCLLAVTMWRRSRFLLLGLCVHMVITVGLAANVALAMTQVGGLLWWVTTSTAGTGLILVFSSSRARRGSYLSAGVVALLLTVGFVFRLCALDTSAFSIFSLWLLPLLVLWAGVGLLWDRFRRGQWQDAKWHDRVGLDELGRNLGWLTIVFSLAVVGAQTWAVLRQLQVESAALVVLSTLAIALLAAAAIRPTPVFLVGLVAQLALNLGVLNDWAQVLDARPMLGWWVVSEPVVVALVLLAAFRWQRRGSTAISALACLAMTAASTVALVLANSNDFSPLWMWVGTAVATWVGIEFMRTMFCSQDFSFEGWSDIFGASLLGRGFERSGMVVGLMVSAMVFGMSLRHFQELEQTLWFLVAVTPALVVASVLRSSPALCASVVGLVTLANVLLLVRAPTGIDEIVTWSLFSETVFAAAALVFFGNRQRRISFAFGGVLALVWAMVTASGLVVSSATFSPYSLWLISMAGFWLVIELMRSGVLVTRGETGGPLRDRIGLDLVPPNSAVIGVPSSLVGATLLTLATSLHFSNNQTPIVLLMAFTIVFVAVTAVRRSVACGAAAGLIFSASHLIFYTDLGLTRAVSEMPLIGFALIVVSIVLAGGIDAWAARTGHGNGVWAWYPLILGLVLGHLFLGRYAAQVTENDAVALPAQMVLVFIVAACGWRFGLVRMSAAGVAGTAWVLVALFARSLTTGGREDLFMAGLLVCVQVILVERLSMSERSLLPESVRGFLHNILVVISALALVLVLYLDNAIRGFWTTSGWSLVALGYVAVGFSFKSPTYRRTGLAVVGLSVLRVVFVDIAQAEPIYRIVAFMCLGGSLVAVSFLYSHFKEKISRWL